MGKLHKQKSRIGDMMPNPTPHVPTEKTRAEVSALTSFGNTQEEIARYLGICVDTLAKYYRNELDNAVLKANAQVARALYNKAVNQDELSAQVFWLKTRAKWREKDREEDISNSDTLDKVKQLVADLNKVNESDV